MVEQSVTMLDMVLDPSPQEKLAKCGSVTLINIYNNGTIGVRTFFCHRWDCPRCGSRRRQEIQDDIKNVSPIWFSTTINDDNYQATRKRIKRAGASYCAVGRGEVLMLTNRPILEDSGMVGGDELLDLIDKHLDCPYHHRQRLVRHSNGLFPPKCPPPSSIHIKRKIAVADKKEAVIGKLLQKEFYPTGELGDEYFLRGTGSKVDVEAIISQDMGHIEWVE